jgi:hypothetical protein
MIKQITSNAKEHWLTYLLTVLASSLVFMRENAIRNLASSLNSEQLATVVVFFAAIIVVGVGWIAVLHVKLVNKVKMDDFEIYHPNIGVTVYRMKESDPKFDSNIWYCPRCLLQDQKLAHVNARHDLGAVWECVSCKTAIHPSVNKLNE